MRTERVRFFSHDRGVTGAGGTVQLQKTYISGHQLFVFDNAISQPRKSISLMTRPLQRLAWVEDFETVGGLEKKRWDLGAVFSIGGPFAGRRVGNAAMSRCT